MCIPAISHKLHAASVYFPHKDLILDICQGQQLIETHHVTLEVPESLQRPLTERIRLQPNAISKCTLSKLECGWYKVAVFQC